MQQLIYSAVVPVSRLRHGKGSVDLAGGYGFARRVNSFPLMAVEFEPALAEYVIVFTSKDATVVPLAVVGARANENVYVSDDFGWLARYIPAFVRRYPFILLASGGGDTVSLCIDEAFAGLNFQGRGQPLFSADGQPTAYVDGMLKFLQEYRAEFLSTASFCKRLGELDLLEPMQAQFDLGSGEKLALTGFMVVSRERLRALPPATLADLAHSGALELIFLHLQSTRNLAALKDRLMRSRSDPQAEAIP